MGLRQAAALAVVRLQSAEELALGRRRRAVEPVVVRQQQEEALAGEP